LVLDTELVSPPFWPMPRRASGEAREPRCNSKRTDLFRQVTEVVGSGPFRVLADERICGPRIVHAHNADDVPHAEVVASYTKGPSRHTR